VSTADPVKVPDVDDPGPEVVLDPEVELEELPEGWDVEGWDVEGSDVEGSDVDGSDADGAVEGVVPVGGAALASRDAPVLVR
jgi:hypothetical protein